MKRAKKSAVSDSLTRFAEPQIQQMAEALDLGYLLPLHPEFRRTLREDYLIISSYRGQPHRTKHIGPAYDISLRLEKAPVNCSARFLIPIGAQ